MSLAAYSIEQASAFLPIAVRVAAMFLMLPIFGDERVPPLSRLALVLMISVAVFGAVEVQSTLPESVVGLALSLIAEFALGIAIGVAARSKASRCVISPAR